MHILPQLISSTKYLEKQGLSQRQLSSMHHFSLNKKEVSFKATYKYFGGEKKRPLQANNTLFAKRVIYVAEQHKLKNTCFSQLIDEALIKWPLGKQLQCESQVALPNQDDNALERIRNANLPDSTTISGIYIVTLNNSEPISVNADDPRYAQTSIKVTRHNCKFGKAESISDDGH